MACLDELRKQQVIDQKIYDQKLIEDTMRNLHGKDFKKKIVMAGGMMTDKRTGEVLNPEVDSTYCRDKF